MFESSGLDDAYTDRNLAVLALAKLAMRAGFRVGVKPDDEWPILYVDLPTGQVSWHIKASDMVGEWPPYDGEWDGHDLEEKRRRVKEFLKE